MKKLLLITFAILLISSQVFAIEFLKKGSYNCSYTHNGKNATCRIYSDGKGTVFMNGDCTNIDNEVTFVKEHSCEYNRISTKNYICTYSNGTCHVTIFENGANTISCKKQSISQYSQPFENSETILNHAKNGKCRPEL